LHVHAGTHHAFFNDTRPEVFDAAASAVAFGRTLELFRSTL
jgi:carboxymethylenebutenolidase